VPYVRTRHPNTALTPAGRRNTAALPASRTLDGHGGCCGAVPVRRQDPRRLRADLSLPKKYDQAAEERFQSDAKTVRKRRDRFLTEGPDGLQDRPPIHRLSPT